MKSPLFSQPLSLLDRRKTSFPSLYVKAVERGLANAPLTEPALVTESDLAPLPRELATYLRRVGAVGRPRVHDFRAVWRGSMKLGLDAPWMEVHAEQMEFIDSMTRIFFIGGKRSGVPFQGLHVYENATASMRIRVASLFDIADARGPEMNQGETVTLFNDLCLIAPASLLGASVVWRSIGDRRIEGTFTNGGNTVRAELSFDAEGDLVNFVSQDRYLSADGKTYTRLPWSTPVSRYRDYGGVRVASHGEAVWTEPTGDFVYARLNLESLELNVKAKAASHAA